MTTVTGAGVLVVVVPPEEVVGVELDVEFEPLEEPVVVLPDELVVVGDEDEEVPVVTTVTGGVVPVDVVVDDPPEPRSNASTQM